MASVVAQKLHRKHCWWTGYTCAISLAGGNGCQSGATLGVSEMGRAGRHVRNIIFDPPKKVVLGNIAIKPLVNSLSLQQIGRGYG